MPLACLRVHSMSVSTSLLVLALRCAAMHFDELRRVSACVLWLVPGVCVLFLRVYSGRIGILAVFCDERYHPPRQERGYDHTLTSVGCFRGSI